MKKDDQTFGENRSSQSSDSSPCDCIGPLPPEDDPSYELQLFRQVESRIKEEWSCERGHQRLRVEDFVARFADLGRPELLRELLKVEIRARLSFNDCPTLEEYRSRFPFAGVEASFFSTNPNIDCIATGASAMESLDVRSETIITPDPNIALDLKQQTMIRQGEARDNSDSHEKGSAEDATGSLELVAQTIVGDCVSGQYKTREKSDPPQFAKNETISPGLSPASPLSLFPKIRGYEIERELGRGGMGVVYQARDSKLHRLVALKTVLFGANANPEHKSRFRTEATAVAKLRHPNIVQIYEIGESESIQYLSLEYVDGRPLDSLADEFKSSRWIAELAAKLAGAVQHAHDNQVVHRDLKPANILLTAEDEPKLTDFGLAKTLNEDSTETRSGAILGTPSFMAPEQASGATKAVGYSADIYGLGATLYFLLAGRPPFREQTVHETLRQVIETPPVPPRKLVPSVHRDLETITLKCLGKTPASRYATAGELQKDLLRYLAGEPILARPARRVEIAWRWFLRNRLVASLMLIAGVLMAILAIGGPTIAVWQGYLRRAAETDRQAAINSRKYAEEQEAEAREARKAFQEQLHGVSLSNGMRKLNSGDLGTSLLWLTKALTLSSNSQIDSLNRQRNRIGEVLAESPWLAQLLYLESSHVPMVEYLKTTDEILTLDSKGLGTFINATDGEIGEEFLRHDGTVLHHALTPDESVLAVSVSYKSIVSKPDQASGAIYIWNLKKKTPIMPGVSFAKEAVLVEFTNDGEQLMTVDSDNLVEFWDWKSGIQIGTAIQAPSDVRSAELNAANDRLFTVMADGTAGIWFLKERTLEHQIDRRDENIRTLAIAPSGQFVVGEDGIGKLLLFEPGTNRPIASRIDCRSPISAVRFNKTGTVLTLLTDDWTAWLIRIGEEGITVFRLLHEGPVLDAWFEEEKLITTSKDRTVRIWSTATGEQLYSPLYHTHPVVDLAIGPNGGIITTSGVGRPVATEYSIVRHWRVESNRNVVTLDPKEHILTVTPLRNGRFLTSGWAEDPDTGVFRVWEPETGNCLVESSVYAWGEKRIIPFDVSPDGRLLATFGGDNHIRFFDLEMRKEQRRLSESVGRPPNIARFSPDGKQLLVVSRGRQIRLWNVLTGEPAGKEYWHAAGVSDAVFSPDGSKVFLACSPIGTWVLDCKSQAVKPLYSKEAFAQNIGCAYATLLAVTPQLLVETSFPVRALPEIRIWDYQSSQMTNPLSFIAANNSDISKVLCNSTASRLLTFGEGNSAVLRDPSTGLAAATLQVAGLITDAAFSPDGKLVATAVTSHDGAKCVVWDAETGEQISPQIHITSRCIDVAFNTSGSHLLAVCEDGNARMWRIATTNANPDEIQRLSEVLNASRIDDNGVVVPLSIDEFKEKWTSSVPLSRENHKVPDAP